LLREGSVDSHFCAFSGVIELKSALMISNSRVSLRRVMAAPT
jgi:hypothetical protein